METFAILSTTVFLRTIKFPQFLIHNSPNTIQFRFTLVYTINVFFEKSQVNNLSGVVNAHKGMEKPSSGYH